MDFSVVIPTFNRAQLLAHTLHSVWRQRFTNYEVIVVNDGSNDQTQEYLDHLKGQDRQLRVIRQANRGPGAARNIGVQEARGDYIAFLDSDDLWFPWTLNIFARAIREHNYPHILGGRFLDFTNETELLNVRDGLYETSWFADYLASSHHPYFVGSGTCVLHREAFARARFLEDRFNAEDHDLILQMGTLPGFVRILAPVTLAWRRHNASETGDFARRVSGALRLLAREKAGAYPGGSERSRERQLILTRHTRPTAVACVRKGALKDGWDLYCSTLGWNVEHKHWKYVLAFPVLAMLALLGWVISREHRPRLTSSLFRPANPRNNGSLH
jgi:glycosyltransferase involved in cell wall biosynthesis